MPITSAKIDFSPQYLAGFFDGEGSVCIAKRYGKSNKGFVLTLCLYNTHEGIISAVHKKYGGHVTAAVRKNSTRPCFQLVICNAQALHFLDDIHPFLVVKRPQADLVYEWAKHRITRQGTRRPDVPQRRAAMLAIREQIMALNRGGAQCQA